MKYLLATFLFIAVLPAHAAPVCQQSDSDPDDDGWGWENEQSCVVKDMSSTDAACIDTDGDGWGWDGHASCLVPVIENPRIDLCVDTDGDGYGWDGSDTCLVDSIEPELELIQVCFDTVPVGDTWGWNGVTACRIPPVITGGDTSAIAGVYDLSDPAPSVEMEYLKISSNGVLTNYYTSSGDCYFREVSSEGDDRTAISPLGGNLYQFDYVYYYSYTNFDGTLVEELEVDSEVLTLYVDSDNQLTVELVDTDDEDLDGNTTEILKFIYPTANVDLDALSLCLEF